MHCTRRAGLALILASVLAPAAAQQAAANKPVTIVVPYSPGSATETEVRIYAQKMTEFLGQPFVLEFKPGAGATLGSAYVAKAAPDGYTLLQVSASFIIAPLLHKDLPYEPLRDFAAAHNDDMSAALPSRRSSVKPLPKWSNSDSP